MERELNGKTDSEIRFFRPDRRLLPYVRYHWVMKSGMRSSVLTFPTGCPQIIFHKRSPLFIPELGRRQSPFTVSGQVNFPAHLSSDGDTEMIVTVFHPHTVGPFIDASPSSFYNLEISGYDLGSRRLDGLAARVFDCDDNVQCINMIERWLLSRLERCSGADSLSGFARVGAAVRRLLEEPSVRVSELASLACLGRKQFERVFCGSVGMNPKEYSRVVRFQKSLWMMQNGADGYADIACACGYADQSHFIREFRAFSCLTPKELAAGCSPYSDLYANPF
jgi:hypothetical protein